ncbi:LysE family translocator [Roseateles sp. DAIF2]|uniref:LysE family translocator n=1 Tax=Roseateles sp. DAIF2 TaxID=2714952 RepID=UPI0018A262C9|nr:LysE family translocator [Roseateles sp. DAIF2]QPF72104.1 LysE family translocator [Roseateles sp. DAIF2]
MSTSTFVLYLLACLAVCLTPGPTTLLAMANGTRRRWDLAAAGIGGAVLSDLILIGAVALGLGALLAASETLFVLLKWCGVAYLAWLGLQLWRAGPATAGAGAPTPRQAFTQCLAVALTNPKGVLFFSAFLPQFIDTSAAQAPQYLQLALATALLDLMVLALYAAGGARLAALLGGAALRRVNKACAAAMFALAGLLALTRRA